jgi:diaminohydroxyphosphoribosylaminopyrimidine deaminase/5-amino-6-(5-phosphoribosylamino)uracil reductase
MRAKQLATRGVKLVFLKTSRGKFEVKKLLNYLSKSGVSQLLVEGGSETAWTFIKSRQVDELFLFLAPIIIGGTAGIGTVGGDGVKTISDAFHLKSYHVRPSGRDLLIHGRF